MRAARIGVGLLPLALVALLFVAVLKSGEPAPWPRRGPASERHRDERCTWSCHNRGCRHPAVLPAWLTADSGLYGQTIAGLYRVGRGLVPGSASHGYGAANLLIFCLVWPAAMYGLYLVALWQRLELRRRRRG